MTGNENVMTLPRKSNLVFDGDVTELYWRCLCQCRLG